MANPDDPNLDDHDHEQPPRRGSRRLVFWGAAALVFAAAVVATLAPQAAGPAGLVLLAGIAAAGLIVLFALAGGEMAARWLAPGGGAAARADREAAQALANSAFEHFPDPALITDRSGAPRAANAAYRALSGAVGDVLQRPPHVERVIGSHPNVAAAVFRLNRAAKRGETVRERLPATLGPSGPARAFDIDVSPLAHGEAMWRVRDRSQDTDGEGAVSGALDGLLEDAPIGFFSAAPDGRVLYVNATLRAWLGVDPSADDLRLKDMVSGDLARVLGKPKKGAPPLRADVVLKGRDGIETPVVVVTSWPEKGAKPASRSVVYALTKSGAPVGVAQTLGSSSAAGAGTLDAMFANAPFGVARLDGGQPASAVIEDANPALLAMTSGAAAPGGRFLDLFLFDDAEEDAEARFAEGGDGFVELALGADKALEPRARRCVHVYFASERGGRKTAYVVDVTKQKDLERQLFQSRNLKAIGELAAGVAHDVNNVLQVIRGNADLLLESHPVGDPSYPELVKINQMVNRGASLVHRLRAFSQQQTIRPQVVDLSASLSDICVHLRQLLEESLRLEVVHGRALPAIKVDKTEFDNMIMNFATNARDAMAGRGGGVLTIATRPATADDVRARTVEEVADGDYAEIVVSDTGCGMDQATLERIFQPFFTTKSPEKGTGLGLAGVFGFVRQSGGHVFVESAVGEGTTFRVYLPAHDAAADAAAPAATPAAAPRPAPSGKPRDLAGYGRILLVEDEAGVRSITSKTLKKRGYEVVEAIDGDEALEILEEEAGRFDLMISDVVMPGMDGPTLLKRGREYLGDARVIFMSGYAEDQFTELLAAEPTVSFLPKPFTSEQLAEKVKQEISRKGEPALPEPVE